MGFFQVVSQLNSGEARCGVISTAHGKIDTPVFMPVGTRGSVKTLWQQQLEEMDASIILGNTYHLYLRPGHQLIERVGGGLHGFISWDRPILTDSGGFQVFSLSKLNKMSEEGVTFQSHIDGSYHLFTPELSMEIQRALGSDIVMCFDECPPLPAKKEQLRESMDLTLRWAKRCREFSLRDEQHLFGIIQGGLELDLRQECLEQLRELDFAGYSLGGLSVGEKNEEMVEFCRNFVPRMDRDKPRYLMGVGTPEDLLQCSSMGVDMFDCVMPTRNARNTQAFTWNGRVKMKNANPARPAEPIDPTCTCYACRNYSRGTIRHLFAANEMLAPTLMTIHNLHFFAEFLAAIRESISAGTYAEDSARWLAQMYPGV